MRVSETESASVALTPWDYRRFLRSVDPLEVRYSRGFLRSEPQKWFPAFPMQWLPLCHAIGAEIRVTEVKPTATLPDGLSTFFGGTVDSEAVGFFLDPHSARVLLDAVIPAGRDDVGEIVLDYLARRLLTSLALSWSGPESSIVKFDAEIKRESVVVNGVVKLMVVVNGKPATVWIGIGPTFSDRLDLLWRRQLHSAARVTASAVEARIEIAQLAVSPALLVDYTKTGAVIDLEVPVSDLSTLRIDGRPWMKIRLLDVNTRLGLEALPGPVTNPVLPDGTTRVTVELAQLVLDQSICVELGQPSAMWASNLALSDRVQLVVNGERVANGKLCTYQGRYAVGVL